MFFTNELLAGKVTLLLVANAIDRRSGPEVPGFLFILALSRISELYATL